jgi:hypothetical protein
MRRLGAPLAGEYQQTPDLLAERAEHFHISPSMHSRLAILDVDYADDFVLRNHRNGKKCFVRILRQIAEQLKPRVVVSFARNCQ